MSNKVAIVTGASRGIGKAIATELVKEKINVVLIGRNESLLPKVTNELNHITEGNTYVAADLTKEESIEKITNFTKSHYGKIDILVNNAGLISRKDTLSTTIEDWNNVISINLTATFLLTQAVLRIMKETRTGNIINITSANGVTPHPNAAPSYGASKAALNYLTKHTALEFAEHNIRCNAIQCGPIETDMSDQWDDTYREEMINRIPLSRLGQPEDVAELVTFLVSDKATFLTGSIINLSGGKLM